MRKTLALAVLAAFVLTVPAATAQDGSQEESYKPSMEAMMQEVEDLGSLVVSVSSDKVAFEWTGLRVGPNMSTWVRGMVDEKFGNADGTVDVSEMETGEEILKPFIGAELNALLTDVRATEYTSYFLIDANRPQAVRVTDLVTDGLVGPVDSGGPITLDFTAVFTFATQAKNVHSVKLDIGQYYFHRVNDTAAAAAVGDFTLTIVGTDGWSIDADSIQPECARQAYSSGAIRLGAGDVNCFTGHSGLIIGFSISGASGGILGVPGFELPLLVLGLAGAAMVIRRRTA